MSTSPSPTSVSQSARRLAASAIALARIRFELFAIEVQEEKERAAQLLFWSVMSALTCGFGLVFLAVLGTVWLWDSYRLVPLAVASLLFVVLAAYGVSRVKHLTGRGASLFKSSLGELRADEAVLRQQGDTP